VSCEKILNKSTIRLVKADITNIEIDSFVYYARSDLALGSGFGTSINIRGGPSIRKELETLGPLNVTEAVVTSAGEMKAGYIIHAVGPKFQEEDTENKLKLTIRNALKCAMGKGLKSIAFPPIGAGFYGVPLETSAMITVQSIAQYLRSDTGIEEVVICAMDDREYIALDEQMGKIN
jgi:O-acetyl-ADP-ribose deacetylase (regulator of RNase III)